MLNLLIFELGQLVQLVHLPRGLLKLGPRAPRGHQFRQIQVRNGIDDQDRKPRPLATRPERQHGRQASGRPASLLAAFLQDLAEVWSELGRDAMVSTAKTNPSTFFAIAARLIPANVELTIAQTCGGLSAEDLAIFQAIRECIPEANSRSPAEVLEYVGARSGLPTLN